MKRNEHEEMIKKIDLFCECYSSSITENNSKFVAGVMYGVGAIRAIIETTPIEEGDQ